MEPQSDPTAEMYGTISVVCNRIDARFFGGQLKPPLISIQRLRGAYGCFAGARYSSADETSRADAVILDARYFGPHRTFSDNVAVLAHELLHSWQTHFGKAGRSGYHNRQFARKLFEIGLVASSTGKPGGSSTGQRMSQYIKPGGAFEMFCLELVHDGIQLPYYEPTENKLDEQLAQRRLKKAASKSAYVCPDCHPAVHVWGKPELKIICGVCENTFVREGDGSSSDDEELQG